MKLAILACHFNPCGYKSRERNLSYFINGINKAGLDSDLFLAECRFPGQETAPDLPSYNVKLSFSTSILWQKETLLNDLAASLPEEYTHIAIVDADVLLPPGFAATTLAALAHYPLLQPWDRAMELGPDGIEQRIRSSCTEAHRRQSSLTRLLDWDCHHPGYVWAMERSFFTTGPGLFPCHIGGSADTLLAIAACTTSFYNHSDFAAFSVPFREKISDYLFAVRQWIASKNAPPLPPALINDEPLQVLHHGPLSARGYGGIRQALTTFDPTIHLEKRGHTCPLEWTETALATALPDLIEQWFASRQEDGHISPLPAESQRSDPPGADVGGAGDASFKN